MKTSNKILSITYLLGFVIAIGILMAAKSNMVIPENITGSGNITTVEKTIPPFQSLKVGNDMNITMIPSTTPFINIEGDEAFQKHLVIEDNGGQLYIGVSKAVKLQNPKPFNIELGVNQLQEINIHGDSSVKMDSLLTVDFINLKLYGASQLDLNVLAQQINIEVNGSSMANLIGRSAFVDANVSGSSSLKSNNLLSNIVHVNVSGSSNAEVYASELLKATASGASNIRYAGTPKQLNDNSSGSSKIQSIK